MYGKLWSKQVINKILVSAENFKEKEVDMAAVLWNAKLRDTVM